MYNYSKNIKICKNKVKYIDNQKYFQIECISDYKDIYAKRLIKKGELGGFVHEKSSDHINSWLEKYEFVGAPIVEAGTVTNLINEIKDISHSNINDYLSFLDEYIKFCRFSNCGTPEPNLINAYLWHSARISEIAFEMFLLEKRIIESKKDISEIQRIILWSLLGTIGEAFLKLHVIILRHKYSNFLQKHKDNYDNIKISQIIYEIYKNNDIKEDEKIFLQKLNGNRNMIHILCNEPVYSYDEYCFSVDNLFKIVYKLYQIQKSIIK